jgi:hypothetical protein
MQRTLYVSSFQHCGWVQLGVGLEGHSLIVTIWSAEGLPMVDSADSISLPKSYAVVRLSIYGLGNIFKSISSNGAD